ncbi:MAG: asparagine synthase (glutamine-hydrolyzing) [Elusimicrobia bacterium]|nr:asparagine synthase (glutamine-hydrolyzing) [Candidatus Obscuribacterium magneticum]
MCGICGQLQWGKPSQIDGRLLERMNRSMIHRGPDDEGYFTQSFITQSPENTGAVGLAMRRLSIIDLSTGRQPIFSEDKNVVVVYNGETYNFQDLRDELIGLGHTFTTRSDTEVLVHGYEAWGLDMPAKLNGMFGFALWDKKRQRLVVGRDRMGIKPLYYAVLKNKLVFGSEIKALIQDPEVSREIDPFAIDDFLSMRYIPMPRSIYKAIRKLEPGSLLLWENGRVQFKPYWNFEPAPMEDRGLSYYLEKLDGLLDDAVRRQLVSDVPLGTFLSGGLDSPTITYYAKKHKPDMMTFNIYFAEKSFSERENSTAVAQFLKTQHVEKEVTPDVVATIPKLIDIFDEPFGDDSMIPTFFLTKMARERMTVALSGDGGDELFGGYPTYIADRVAALYRKIPHFLTRGLLEPVINHLPVSFSRISLDYKAKAFVAAARRPPALAHFGWTEVFRPEIKKNLYSESFYASVASRPLAESYVNAYESAGARTGLERFLYLDQKTHLVDEFLVKVDRLSMAHSLEVRPPFLDHRIVEFAAEVPMHYKLRGWTTKVLIRRLMKGRIPEAVIRGGKKGFSPPMAKWLATDLLDYARFKFSPERLRQNPYLNPTVPLELLEQHVRRQTNLARRLWTLLMFVEWYDRKVLGRD